MAGGVAPDVPVGRVLPVGQGEMGFLGGSVPEGLYQPGAVHRGAYRFVIRSWASTPALYQPKQAGPTFPPLISSVQISCRICTSFFFPYSFVKAAKIGLYNRLLRPDMVDEQTAAPLSRLLFAHLIQVEDDRLRKVYVYQPGNLRPSEYKASYTSPSFSWRWQI